MRFTKPLVLLAFLAAGCRGLVGPPGWEVEVIVQGAGDGNGQVHSATTGVSITCAIANGEALSSGCTDSFTDAGMGGQFELVATPGEGHLFGGWSGECSGLTPRCLVTFDMEENEALRVQAAFLRIPAVIEVTVTDPALDLGESTAATVSTTPTVADTTTFTWTSSNPAVVSVTPHTSGEPATVTAVGPGTATITASARTRVSEAVEVVVSDAPVAPGILEGVLYDVDGTTPLSDVYLTARMVNAPAGAPTYRTWTGSQAGEPVPDGGYSFEMAPGPYAAFTVGVAGNRWVSTPGDTAQVASGQTTTLDLNIKRGYHLDMRETDLGEITAAAGQTVTLTVDFTAWCRDGAPACAPSLALGVQGTPLTLYRFTPPGAHATGGLTETGVTLDVTVPAAGGTLYALLVTISTNDASGGIQAGLDHYANTWAQGLEATMFIPIGTLTVQ